MPEAARMAGNPRARLLFVEVETERQPPAETQLGALLRTVETRALDVAEQSLERRCPVKRTGARHLHGLFHDADCGAAEQRAACPHPACRQWAGLAAGSRFHHIAIRHRRCLL